MTDKQESMKFETNISNQIYLITPNHQSIADVLIFLDLFDDIDEYNITSTGLQFETDADAVIPALQAFSAEAGDFRDFDFDNLTIAEDGLTVTYETDSAVATWTVSTNSIAASHK